MASTRLASASAGPVPGPGPRARGRGRAPDGIGMGAGRPASASASAGNARPSRRRGLPFRFTTLPLRRFFCRTKRQPGLGDEPAAAHAPEHRLAVPQNHLAAALQLHAHCLAALHRARLRDGARVRGRLARGRHTPARARAGRSGRVGAGQPPSAEYAPASAIPQTLAPSVRRARFDGWFVLKLDQPLAPAEFVALDTETNGYGGDLCEMTEVGAVLVGGGELHETFDSLVRVERPLSRGIQRFTGITQGMVDGAPPPDEVLPELADLLEGRVMVAHNARFDVRRAARRRSSARGSTGRSRRCCARCSSRAASPRWRASAGSRTLAGSLGIEVDEVHRALPDALTCARVFCALFPKLCANAVTIGDALDLLRSRRRARKTEPAERDPAATSARTSRRCRTTRACTSSATSAGGRCTWGSRCRCARARGRTSARPPAGPSAPRSWTTGRRTRSSARSCSRTG